MRGGPYEFAKEIYNFFKVDYEYFDETKFAQKNQSYSSVYLLEIVRVHSSAMHSSLQMVILAMVEVYFT